MSRGGLAAVSVETLAADLGVTKGSFYHHFGTRDDLLAAALELWEDGHTRRVNAQVEATALEPRARLEVLVREAVRMAEQDPVGLTLLADAAHPLVAPVLERVTATRLAYLATLYRQSGHPAATARRLALLTYSTYLGHAQLTHSTPGVMPRTQAARHEYLALVLDRLAPPPP